MSTLKPSVLNKFSLELFQLVEEMEFLSVDCIDCSEEMQKKARELLERIRESGKSPGCCCSQKVNEPVYLDFILGNSHTKACVEEEIAYLLEHYGRSEKIHPTGITYAQRISQLENMIKEKGEKK